MHPQIGLDCEGRERLVAYTLCSPPDLFPPAPPSPLPSPLPSMLPPSLLRLCRLRRLRGLNLLAFPPVRCFFFRSLDHPDELALVAIFLSEFLWYSFSDRSFSLYSSLPALQADRLHPSLGHSVLLLTYTGWDSHFLRRTVLSALFLARSTDGPFVYLRFNRAEPFRLSWRLIMHTSSDRSPAPALIQSSKFVFFFPNLYILKPFFSAHDAI